MTDIFLLTIRTLKYYHRNPVETIPGIAISVFFLLVYNAGLSDVSTLPGFTGSYLAFILPVAIISAAISGAGLAGQSLVRDIQTGYYTKLLLSPAKRLAITWGAMIAGAVVLLIEALLILGLGLIMGLTSKTGVGGYATIILLTFIWGMAFSGFSVFVALKTRSANATQASTFVFFPLIFLSATFVPKAFITSHWLKVAATYNPTTYAFDAMRSLLINGWEVRPLVLGFGILLAFATITGAMSLIQAQRSTRME
jgi:ABC-2 type transport system permease protein